MGSSRRAGYRMKFWSFLSNPDKWIRGHIRRGLKHALFGDVIAECKGERGEYKASKAADKYRTVTQAMTDKTITKLFGESVERTTAKLRTLHAM